VDVNAYLRRIGYSGGRAPTIETLRALHRAHMYTVPFENLDIFGSRRHLTIDEGAFFRKVVGERRGGFCYELNGLFAALLRELGFRVELLSGRVVSGKRIGPEFDHLLILVHLQERWIADVGFGESSRIPMRLDDPAPQGEPSGAFRFEHDGPEWSMWQLAASGKWTEAYRFTLTPHHIGDFAGMCEYHQTSPDSPFMRNNVCTLATPNGRKTVSGNRLTIVADGERTITRLADDAAYHAALLAHFGVTLA
jgi:N-hydroxyarylamine O-acetyltransferase